MRVRKTRHWRKNFPYYKVQVFNVISQSWKDERRAHDTIEEAERYVAEKISPRAGRIMVVEEKRRYVLGSE